MQSQLISQSAFSWNFRHSLHIRMYSCIIFILDIYTDICKRAKAEEFFTLNKWGERTFSEKDKGL